MKIPKGQWKAVNPRTDNTVAKQKKKKTRTNNDPLTVHRTHNDPLTVHRTNNDPLTVHRTHNDPLTVHRTNNDPLTVHRTHNDPLTVHRTKQLSNTNPSKKPGPLPSKIQALCPVKTRRSA